MFGADLSADWQAPGTSTAIFAGAGYTRLAPRFRVHFRNAANELDATRVRADVGRLAFFAGASRAFGQRWRGGGEVYGTTADGATIRLVVDAVLARGTDR
jgi:hypothetical protein